MEAEGVEEGDQEQKADNTKNDDYQDGVDLHVHLLPWEQGGGGQEARGLQSSTETGQRRLYGGHVVNFRHDGKFQCLFVAALRGNKYSSLVYRLYRTIA